MVHTKFSHRSSRRDWPRKIFMTLSWLTIEKVNRSVILLPHILDTAGDDEVTVIRYGFIVPRSAYWHAARDASWGTPDVVVLAGGLWGLLWFQYGNVHGNFLRVLEKQHSDWSPERFHLSFVSQSSRAFVLKPGNVLIKQICITVTLFASTIKIFETKFHCCSKVKITSKVWFVWVLFF